MNEFRISKSSVVETDCRHGSKRAGILALPGDEIWFSQLILLLILEVIVSDLSPVHIFFYRISRKILTSPDVTAQKRLPSRGPLSLGYRNYCPRRAVCESFEMGAFPRPILIYMQPHLTLC
jgi:hypothetical protein